MSVCAWAKDAHIYVYAYVWVSMSVSVYDYDSARVNNALRLLDGRA